MKTKFLLVLSGMVLSAGLVAESPVSLSRSPVFVRPPVDPNIILTFDDSGSMNLGLTPNEIDGTYLPKNDTTCFWRDLPHMYAAAANTQYFDPEITYAPPAYEDGSAFPDAVFTAAYYDGFNAHRTKNVEVTTSPKRNLATDYAVSLYGEDPPRANFACSPAQAAPRTNPGTNGNLVTFGLGSQGTCTTSFKYTDCNGKVQTKNEQGGVRKSLFDAPNNKRAFYYTFNNTNAIDPATGKKIKPTREQLFGPATPAGAAALVNYRAASYGSPILVSASQETNFANWYSYYRTRTLMGRSSSSRAFSQLPRNVRILWQGMNGDRLGLTSGGAATALLPIKRIDDKPQRVSFYSYLHNVGTSGGTPTRSSTDRVGNYFSQPSPKTTFNENNPYYDKTLDVLLGGNNANSVLSCRQNYHMIFTDGGWKDDMSNANPKVSFYPDKNTDQTDITNLPSSEITSTPVAGNQYTVGGTHTKLYSSGPRQTRAATVNGYAAQANIGGFADRAFYYWATDLQPSLRNNVVPFIDDRSTGVTGTLLTTIPADPLTNEEIYWNPKNDPASWQHVVQYVVAFGLTSSLNFPADLEDLRKGSKVWTNWADQENNDPTVKVDDTWHATLNSRGELLAASNPQELVQQMNTVFQAISARTASVSTVSISSSLLATSTLAFRTFFNASAWSGSVQGFKFKANAAPEIIWDASCLLTGGYCAATNTTSVRPDPVTGRKIYTSKGTSGVDFMWSNLSATQQTLMNYNWDTAMADPSATPLGEQRVLYLRGDRTREGLDLRSRESVLGAVVNSNALFVDTAVDAYWQPNESATKRVRFPNSLSDLSSFPETKANFILHSNSLKTRPATVYVGANDGMLHAFQADNGVERWAYVPQTGFEGLARLTSKYQLFTQSSVDSTPTTREIFVGGSWKTILVGSMRFGGQGIFALDITNPNPTGAAAKFMWEFNDRSPNGADVGFTYGRPAITRLKANKKWVVLLPGGYNSQFVETPKNPSAVDTVGSGNSVLFVLDAQTGAFIRKFDLGANTNGLSSVVAGDYVFEAGSVSAPTKHVGFYKNAADSVLRRSTDEVTDVAFAGDNNGDLYRFNLENDNPSLWTATKFFDAALNQKITAQPRIVSAGGYAVVVFGTGRYVTVADRGDSTAQVVCGLYDPGPGYTGYPLEQADVTMQTVTLGSVGTKKVARITNNPVAPNKFGWCFNLPSSGERVVAAATSIRSAGKIIVPSFTPSKNPATASDPCVDDSESALYFLNPLNGGVGSSDGIAAFDTNGDGVVNASDDATIAGITLPGFVAGATPVSQAGGGQGQIILPSPPGSGAGSPISTLATPEYVWRRATQRELPAFDSNESN